MKFEVVNSGGETVMQTEYIECIPDQTILDAMYKSGYRFKLNGKMATKKKVEETRSNT